MVLNASSAAQSHFSGQLKAWGLALIKVLTLGQLVYLSNFGFGHRIGLLFERGQYLTLLPFLLIWLVGLVAMAVAAFHPSRGLRLFWGLLLGLGTAVGLGYFMSSQSQLTAQDLVSFWNARHEAGHAAGQYAVPTLYGIAALLLYVLASLLPVPALSAKVRKALWIFSPLPLLPMATVAGVVWLKGHTSSQALPNQFVPISLAAVVGAKLYASPIPVRQGVAWTPGRRLSKSIVMLVDESIRADYIDFTPGNPFTPHMAAVRDRFVDFGPAASTGNCSNYSNVMLRYLASRKDLRRTINQNASIFAHAKKAGYRTVYIDAQAGNITDGNMMQNFMTLGERENIDAFHGIRGVAAEDADTALMKIMERELQSPVPTFIYANKYGAHFPYDEAYPAAEAPFQPTQSLAGDSASTRQASYRNAVKWSVDRLLPELVSNDNLQGAALIYTSDHGQLFEPGRLTHCQVEGSDERMALVPLLVHTDDDGLRSRLERGAAQSRGAASHFQIAATVLELMGYATTDISTAYDESLTAGTTRPAAYTSGDVFGLFQDEAIWNPIDLRANHLEPGVLDAPGSTAVTIKSEPTQG